MLQKIFTVISGARFSLDTEEALKKQMAELFTENGIPFQRERTLDKKNRLDFFVENIAIEVKIKGASSAMSVFRQCKRYCEFPEVGSLLLITNKAMGFPEEINGKPCYVINLGKSWL